MNLISAKTLAEKTAEYLLVDCRFSLADPAQGERLYRRGHLPGAYYAHLDHHLSSKITPLTGRHPLPDFNALVTQLGLWGIDEDCYVVAYDDSSGVFASRLWWLLRTLGHHRVAVLDGGIQAWQALGQPLETVPATGTPTQFVPRLDRDAWRDIDQLQECLAEQSCVLVDARTRERFNGESEPIDPVAGHIPGSVNMPITENINTRGFFLAPQVLRENYLGVIGNANPEQVIHSCGSGVFACFGILSMELAGLNGSKLYPGSWSEWIRDPARAIETS